MRVSSILAVKKKNLENICSSKNSKKTEKQLHRYQNTEPPRTLILSTLYQYLSEAEGGSYLECKIMSARYINKHMTSTLIINI